AAAFAADPATPAPAPTAPATRPAAGLNMPDPLLPTLNQIGLLNLSPTFTLTADQKAKIQAIRDDYQKQVDKWKSDHDADIKKINDEMTQARQNAGGGGAGGAGGGGGGANFRTIMQERQTLVASAPKADDAIKAIRAVLDETEQKALDKAEADAAA